MIIINTQKLDVKILDQIFISVARTWRLFSGQFVGDQRHVKGLGMHD